MEAKGEVVGCRLAGGVEVFDLVEAAAHDVVVADNDAGDRGEENGVGGQVGCEVIGGRQKVPVDERVNDRPVYSYEKDLPWTHS